MPMFEMTCQFASFDPPPAQEQEVLSALYGNRDATDEFMSVLAGTLRVQDFYDPSNIERYLLAAATNPSE
jgi:hypothetical protein